MDDDLNTAEALAAIFEFVRETNSLLDEDRFLEGNRASGLELLERFDSVFDVLKLTQVDGSLGDAENVDHFDFHRMVVGPCCRMEGTASRSPATAKSAGCAGRGDYKRDVLKYGGYMARWVG